MPPLAEDLSHAALKARQRTIRDGFPENLALRVHRAISWFGRAGNEDYLARMAKSLTKVNQAMAARDTATLLSILFDRLYVLRIQMVHGGATWNSKVNRDQLRDGVAVLSSLLPIFISVMMDHPTRDWGKPFYPVVL